MKDGRYIWLAGLVLVRQRPGSAKGVMFITIEDETGIANLIVWPSMFEQNRRIVMGARMIGLYGQVQREGEVVHVIVKKLVDLSALLSSLSEKSTPFPISYGRGDGAKNGGGPDPRAMPQPRDILIPDLHIDTARDRALVKSRNFK
jgi:error-prone DNA polymerase